MHKLNSIKLEIIDRQSIVFFAKLKYHLSKTRKMTDDLPTEFDLIVVGTGIAAVSLFIIELDSFPISLVLFVPIKIKKIYIEKFCFRKRFHGVNCGSGCQSS